MGLLVVSPGLAATVQDLGRVGYREWGVPVGGAFDHGSAALANALLGNPLDCAVVELTLIGGAFEALAPLALALAGAPMEAAIQGRDDRRRAWTLPSSFPLAEGERLILGGTPIGARTYLAVKGGWRTPLVLGSRSSEARLKPGDILPAKSGSTPVRRLADGLAPAPQLNADRPIRLIDGPDAPDEPDWDWEARSFRVGPKSDRMGLRLEGEAIALPSQPERASMPVAPGAVQVAGGQLILLGVACGTMGGYPHVAHVVSADLDRVGQARPGDVLRFRRIGLDEARGLDRERRALRAGRLRCLTAMATDGPIPTADPPI